MKCLKNSDLGLRELWKTGKEKLFELDSLYFPGFTTSIIQIGVALNWLVNGQLNNGLWDLKLFRTKDKYPPLWIVLVICRFLKNFYG